MYFSLYALVHPAQYVDEVITMAEQKWVVLLRQFKYDLVRSVERIFLQTISQYDFNKPVFVKPFKTTEITFDAVQCWPGLCLTVSSVGSRCLKPVHTGALIIQLERARTESVLHYASLCQAMLPLLEQH